ncbi:uncharacterized protein LOC144530383 isoform X3 [Sander vitreus]
MPPQANVQDAQRMLADQMLCVERTNPDSLVIVLGDFNKGNLTHVLPKYRQHIKCPTREDNILDHCYTTVRDAYHAVPRAALGLSDHVMVHLIPAYRQKLKLCKPVVRTSRKWPSEAVEHLQSCLDSTDWDVFRTATNSLDEYTEAVTSYISFCEDCCVPSCTRVSFTNDKPWFTAKLRRLRLDKADAFRSGDKDRLKEAKYKFSKAPKKPRTTGLNDFRPIALSSVVMKSFERLVLSHLKAITDPLLDPLQFAYRANRSVDDAVNLALHYILRHLDSAGTYARILFVDFSSAFNTIIPALLQEKLSQLGVPDSTCRWITDFLSDRKQHVKLGKDFSNSQTISTGSPQGCVLSPLLFSLYTNSGTSSHQSVKLLKFADDTSLIRLISDGDESAYRSEADHLVKWCKQNYLELNAPKTVEMVVDFRRKSHHPLWFHN